MRFVVVDESCSKKAQTKIILGPAFEGIQLGIGPHVIEKAIAQTCGKTTDVVKAMMTEMGDLGSVAMACRQTQVSSFLVVFVFDVLSAANVDSAKASHVARSV